MAIFSEISVSIGVHHCLWAQDTSQVQPGRIQTHFKSHIRFPNSMKNRATHLQKMASDDVSGSETDETEENSSSDEPGNPNNGETQAISEYEKQRLSRIAENRARLEALGLPKMASSLMGSVQLKQKQKQKQKGKAKVVEDEDYTPPVAEEGSSSSNGDDDDDDKKEFAGGRSSGARVQKVVLLSQCLDTEKIEGKENNIFSIMSNVYLFSFLKNKSKLNKPSCCFVCLHMWLAPQHNS